MLLTEQGCKDTEFRCQYVYQCVDAAKADDGVEDCLDRSDEGLPLRVYDSPPRTFSCNSSLAMTS